MSAVTTRAALPSAPAPGPREETAAITADLRRVISYLGRNPANREIILVLERIDARLWEHDQRLDRHDALIAEAVAVACGAAAPAPAEPEPPGRRAGYLRAVRILAPLAGLAGGGWWKMHKRAASVAAAGVLLTGSTLGFTVRTLPHVSAVQPHVTVQAAAAPASPAPPQASAAMPRASRARRRHRAHRAPVPPPRPVQPVTPAPPATAPATPAPPPPQGVLTVRSALIQAGAGTTVMLPVTASGGPVNWAAYASGGVILRQDAGRLDAGQTVLIPVTADGAGVITIEPGGVTVQVVITPAGGLPAGSGHPADRGGQVRLARLRP